MRAHGHLRDEEAGRDLGGRQAFAQELEDLPLALAEAHARPLGEKHGPPPAALPELLDQLRHEGAGEGRLPGEDSAEVGGELATVDVLEEIARGAGAEGVEEVSIVP